MPRIINNSETVASISIYAWLLLAQSLLVLLGIILLIKHFRNNPHINRYLQIFSVFPLLLTLAVGITQSVIFNNSLISSINSHYPFIDKLCGTPFELFGASAWHIIRYSTWIFYLYRIKFYFAKSPKYRVTTTMFMVNIMLYTICSLVSFCLHINWTLSYNEAPVAIYIASDNPNYKTCTVYLDRNLEMDIFTVIAFIINEGVISIYLLYLLYSKTTNLERDQQENKELSIHFSQRDDGNVISTKIMRRCIFYGLLSLIIHCVNIVICVTTQFRFKIIFFRLCVIANIMSILVSFDIKFLNRLLCICCNFGNVLDTLEPEQPNDEKAAIKEQIELTQSRTEYNIKPKLSCNADDGIYTMNNQ